MRCFRRRQQHLPFSGRRRLHDGEVRIASQRRQERGQVDHFRPRQLVDQPARHQRSAGLLDFNLLQRNRDLLVVRIPQDEIGVSLADLDAGQHFTVIGRHDRRVEVLLDPRIRIDDRLQDVIGLRRSAEAHEVRPHHAPRVADGVTLQALQVVATEQLLPAGRIAVRLHFRQQSRNIRRGQLGLRIEPAGLFQGLDQFVARLT